MADVYVETELWKAPNDPMATSGGFEKWMDRLLQQWPLELFRNLRSGLGWWDVLVGLLSTIVIAL
ncbi:MAG: hypothetical protein LBP68_03700, partial [Acidobacteriota bacterium]|nr:hypothetical protein [Acidobacteriota bacterium]